MNRNNEENVIAGAHEHTQQLFNNPIKLFLLFLLPCKIYFVLEIIKTSPRAEKCEINWYLVDVIQLKFNILGLCLALASTASSIQAFFMW